MAEGATGKWIFLNFQPLVTKFCIPSGNCMSEEPKVEEKKMKQRKKEERKKRRRRSERVYRYRPFSVSISDIILLV